MADGLGTEQVEGALGCVKYWNRHGMAEKAIETINTRWDTKVT